jgi:imidazoleglycerol-phosphate dehydratase
MARTAQLHRETGETRIDLWLDLDGTGSYEVATGVGFFDHMLALLSRHSLIDLKVRAAGDLHVDAHHTVEDVGLCFGRALAQALGEKAEVPSEMLGAFNAPLAEEFWRAVSSSGALALHVVCHHGHNAHHVIEAIFKATARALRQAVEPDPRGGGIPSTKGIL